MTWGGLTVLRSIKRTQAQHEPKATWHFLTLPLLQLWSKGYSTDQATASLGSLVITARWVCSPLPQAMEPASGQAASTSPFALPAKP